jgi:hypothetical protein
MILKGTEGVVIECYDVPEEGYAVDINIPNSNAVGGYLYDNIVLTPEQFDVMEL